MRESILQMDKHDIFELTEALYAFAILNHSGQWSEIYRLQCEIGNAFTPSYSWSEETVERENMYYNEITEDNIQGIWNRVKYYLDNRWDDE